jgi:hypothetical protein
MFPRVSTVCLAAVLLAAAAPEARGQDAGELGQADALRRHHPGLYDLLGRLERAHGVLFGELAGEGESVRANGGEVPTPGFEADLVGRLTSLVQGEERSAEVAGVADAGYEALGSRTAGIIRWGHAFQREVLSILADPAVTDRNAALSAAVGVYRGRAEAALPNVPKNMDVLYGHPYALAFRTGYPDLDGLLWAGHWLRLATTEPLTDLPPGPDRLAGVDTVATRHHGKLSHGEPPQSFPSELPLAPAIAPGFIWLSPESAMIWDNLSMLLEVIADVLASPEAVDARGAVDAAVDFFMEADLAVTDQDEWEIMALRHGIFFQGGFPLAVMTENERNSSGHAAHLAGGRRLMAIPGMPRR